MIESYYHQNVKVSKIAAYLKRSRTPIYNIANFLKKGHTALDYCQQYKKNKKRCGRRKIDQPTEQQEYTNEKVAQGWTPHIIIGRKEMPINCSMRTLYRRFKDKVFDETTLPLKERENKRPSRMLGKTSLQAEYCWKRVRFPGIQKRIRPYRRRYDCRCPPQECRHHLGGTSVQNLYHLEAQWAEGRRHWNHDEPIVRIDS